MDTCSVKPEQAMQVIKNLMTDKLDISDIMIESEAAMKIRKTKLDKVKHLRCKHFGAFSLKLVWFIDVNMSRVRSPLIEQECGATSVTGTSARLRGKEYTPIFPAAWSNGGVSVCVPSKVK